jgi:hypothetical protein
VSPGEHFPGYKGEGAIFKESRPSSAGLEPFIIALLAEPTDVSARAGASGVGDGLFVKVPNVGQLELNERKKDLS